MNNKPLSPVVAGLLVAGLLAIFSIIVNLVGAQAGGMLGLLQYAIIIVATMLLVKQWGKAMNNEVTFGQLFGYGFQATAVYTLIFFVFIMAMIYLSPDIKKMSMDAVRVELEKQNRPESEIEKALQIVDKYFYITVGGTTVFFTVLMGTIGSLIGAGITQKRPQNPFDQYPQ